MIKVLRLNKLDGFGSLRAFADIQYYNLRINGLRIVEGKQGWFISMPRTKEKTGEYSDVCSPVDIETRREIDKILLEEYRKELDNDIITIRENRQDTAIEQTKDTDIRQS